MCVCVYLLNGKILFFLITFIFLIYMLDTWRLLVLFFYIQQLTTCWHHACNCQKECVPNAFRCGHGNTSRNLKFPKDFCPVNPPNSTIFYFGIFIDALESNIVGTTDVPKKYLQCSWLGLLNLRFEDISSHLILISHLFYCYYI